MFHETKTCDFGNKRVFEVKQFESIGEIIDYTESSIIDQMAGDEFYIEWLGRDMGNSANARKLANEVWHDGLRLFDSAKDKISSHSLPAPKTRRRRARFDEFGGDEVCVDRLRSGAPFWRTTKREQSDGTSSLTIVVNIGAPASRHSDEIIWRGVAAVCLCELLEAAGYRVEIISYDASIDCYKEDNSSHLATVQLKSCDEPLDTVGLIAATSGWFYRVFGIGAIRRSCLGKTPESGCGLSQTLSSEQFESMTGRKPTVMIGNVWSEADAVELIEDTLKTIADGSASLRS